MEAGIHVLNFPLITIVVFFRLKDADIEFRIEF